MLSADLIPCTLTLPLMSLARLAPANAATSPAATTAFAAIFNRLIAPSPFQIFRTLKICRSRLRSEDVVNSRLERVRTEVQCVSRIGRVGIRLAECVLILPEDFYVGAHQHLETRAEAVSGAILRGGRAVYKVRARIHCVVVESANQPGIKPVVGAGEAPRKRNGRCGRKRRAGIYDVVVVM